jgi:hypothetical protein
VEGTTQGDKYFTMIMWGEKLLLVN